MSTMTLAEITAEVDAHLVTMDPNDPMDQVVTGFLTALRGDAHFDFVAFQPKGEERRMGHPGKGLWLQDGRNIDCKVVARDMLGNWSVVTETGMVQQFLFDEIL